MDLLVPKTEQFTDHDSVMIEAISVNDDKTYGKNRTKRNGLSSKVASTSNNNHIKCSIAVKKYKKKRQQCPHCPADYSKREYLSKHMKNEHNVVLEKKRPGRQSLFFINPNDPRPYKCDQCVKEYMKSKHLARHRRTHFETKRCNECNEICGNYAEHMLKRHGIDLPRPFECDICKKTYRTKTHIQSHMRIHRAVSSSKIYCCTVCPKSFCFGTDLRKHMRTHSQNRSVICDICGDAFKSSDTLKCHMRRHTGEKPYKCSICPKAFSTSNSLDIHFRTHTGERPYKCEYCEKSFSDSSTLIVHKRLHTNENPYTCHLCGRRTKQASNLRSHYRHFHKNNDISGRQIRLNSRIFSRFTQFEIDTHLQQTGGLIDLLERGLQEYHREESEKNSQIEKAIEVIIAPKVMQSTFVEDKATVIVKQEKAQNVPVIDQNHATSVSMPIVKCNRTPSKSPNFPSSLRHPRGQSNSMEMPDNNYAIDTKYKESSPDALVETCSLPTHKTPMKIESVFIEDEMSQAPEIENFAFDDVKHEHLSDNDWQNDCFENASNELPFSIMKCESLQDGTTNAFENLDPKVDQVIADKFNNSHVKQQDQVDNSFHCDDDNDDDDDNADEVDSKMQLKAIKTKIVTPKIEMERCIPCNRKFHDLSKHWVECHSNLERPFECFICHKDYKRYEHIKYHMKTHGDERNYICHVCGDAFFLSNDLRKHIMNRHQVDRPYKCTHQQCKKCFKNQHALNVHMRTHSGIKPFVCAVCSEAFSALSSLRIHERKHTGDKPYVCKFCNKAFADCSTHKQHVRIHTGEKPYKCHLCDRRTAQAGNLKSHYRHYHKIIVKSVSMYMDHSTVPFSEEIHRNPFERAHGIASYPLFDPSRRIEE